MQPIIVEGILADIDGVRPGQVVIENGIIAAVGPNLGKAAACLRRRLPDLRRHGRHPHPCPRGRHRADNYKETFATAAAAALHGGVVHVADMPNNPGGADRRRQLRRQGNAAAASRICRSSSRSTPASARARGRLSARFPTRRTWGRASATCSSPRWRSSTGRWPAIAGRAVSFHCEDPVLLEKHKGAADARSAPARRVRAERHALRPGDDREVSAHGQAVPLLRRRRTAADPRRQGDAGLPVTAEVTPHHVFFDTAQITAANRPGMQMNPPLRGPADRAAMLEALRDGTADYLATDHAPHTLAEKARASPASRTWTPMARSSPGCWSNRASRRSASPRSARPIRGRSSIRIRRRSSAGCCRATSVR